MNQNNLGKLAAMKRVLGKKRPAPIEDEQPGQPEREPDADDMPRRPFGR